MLRSYRIIIIATICCIPVTGVFASTTSEKGDSGVKSTPHATGDHPPHDHQHNNHIKKLDEGMQRRKNKKLN